MIRLVTFIAYVFIINIILILAFSYLDSKFKGKFTFVLNLAWVFVCFSIVVILVTLFTDVFLLSMTLVYSPLEYVFRMIFKSINAAAYMSLTLTLLFFAYAPEKLGYWILLLLEKTKVESVHLSKIYLVIIKALRIKLMIYFISFALVLLSSIETFYSKCIIQNSMWIQFKPVILQAVVTVIAFDRFINLLIKEWNSITCDTKKVLNILSPALTLLKKKEKI